MDITERLRALYVEHGTNYVQEAADEIERLRGVISEERTRLTEERDSQQRCAIRAMSYAVALLGELRSDVLALAHASEDDPQYEQDYRRCNAAIEKYRALLDTNPNPAGPSAPAEASETLPAEASGAGGAGTVFMAEAMQSTETVCAGANFGHETGTKSYVATTLDSINSAIGAINAGHPEVAADFLRVERSRHQSNSNAVYERAHMLEQRLSKALGLLKTVQSEWVEVETENSGLLWQIRHFLGMNPDHVTGECVHQVGDDMQAALRVLDEYEKRERKQWDEEDIWIGFHYARDALKAASRTVAGKKS